MANLSESENSLFENPGNVPYRDQMIQSDEKFSKWERKSFSERQSVFKKVTNLRGYSEDLLSNWISEQMDILLAKSVMG
ncbi:hypothetical protein [Pedobacter psychroterrae]|uniref:Uncharacterized protein n=1 Tax=Pedobacter psychroterrae TaxID=2530453 RepID=A0A4R0NMP8_9SPHI|nr:hypothetical protein [Pedobacter psychroterrae]TCD01499.1 hypothetical protein EZ437_12240 [Pedobacter psychroterrae]